MEQGDSMTEEKENTRPNSGAMGICAAGNAVHREEAETRMGGEFWRCIWREIEGVEIGIGTSTYEELGLQGLYEMTGQAWV